MPFRTGFITVIITRTHLMCYALMLFAHAVHPKLRQFYHLATFVFAEHIIIVETAMSPSWFVLDSINLRSHSHSRIQNSSRKPIHVISMKIPKSLLFHRETMREVMRCQSREVNYRISDKFSWIWHKHCCK